MSEPKLISPLLDGFVMGNAMSEHDGISCHPAIKENTDEKYIVKIISIPASQVQMDALLLTGAYRDPADAMDYFKSVADGIIKEAEILHKLSKLDGFLSYDGLQVVPKENGRLGSHIYLLGAYRRSLERHMRRSRMTHLEAVNLGLDLCQALAICRRAGYLYVDLKPSNVFISKNREYRIGDIGFVELDSLKYTSHPGKYFSAYSAPEGKDAMNTINTTADTYSVGMILYQVFNDGQLPVPSKDPTKPVLPPVNADYEISGIIMKAIAPNPADRWASPMEMGQALVGYMQRNSINNTPLEPKTEIITDPEAPKLVREAASQTKVLPNLRNITTSASVSESLAKPIDDSEEEKIAETAEQEQPNEAPAPVEEPEAVEVPVVAEEPAEEVTQEQNREDAIAAEISSLFTSADHPLEPEPLSVDIPYEAPAAVQPAFEDDDGFSLEGIFDEDIITDEDLIMDEEYIEDVAELRKEPKKMHPIVRKILTALVVLLVIAALACGGIWFYQSMYLQSIDSLEIVSTLDEVTVKLSSEIDDSLLSVTCMDSYGNSQTQPVENGQASFSDLQPNSQYKVQVEISGLHKLTGKVSDVFNTAAQSNIVSLTAIAGPEDGSVLLNMVVDGTDPESWELKYSAQGEEEKTLSFIGHSVTIKELALGKTYTFTIQNPEGIVLTGQSSVEFASTELVMAENLRIIACSDGALTAAWDAPEGVQIDTWTVRCYNDADFEQVQENISTREATFTGIDTTRAYTVEVTAAGMTQPIRTNITTNPITITEFTTSEETPGKLDISWQHEGKAPVGGWLLMHRVDNAEKSDVIKCDKPTASISPKIPNATYHFEIQAADSTSIFSNQHEVTTTGAEVFDFQGLSGEKIVPYLLKTPEDQEWTYESISNDDFTNSFSVGDSISVVLHGTVGFYIPEEEISAMYVIRDKDGNVLSNLVTEETLNWKDLWFDGDPRRGELDLPVSPAEAGSYTVEIYFDNFILTTAEFTLS